MRSILSKENGVKNEMDEMCEKSCGLSFDSPLLLRKNALFFDESRVFVFRSSLPVSFLTRAGVPERTRARVSRTQRV